MRYKVHLTYKKVFSEDSLPYYKRVAGITKVLDDESILVEVDCSLRKCYSLTLPHEMIHVLIFQLAWVAVGKLSVTMNFVFDYIWFKLQKTFPPLAIHSREAVFYAKEGEKLIPIR